MSDPILVVIFLRGGADSLALAAPTADLSYIAARPPSLRTLRDGDTPGLPLGDALADVDFRLHPAAAPSTTSSPPATSRSSTPPA